MRDRVGLRIEIGARFEQWVLTEEDEFKGVAIDSLLCVPVLRRVGPFRGITSLLIERFDISKVSFIRVCQIIESLPTPVAISTPDHAGNAP